MGRIRHLDQSAAEKFRRAPAAFDRYRPVLRAPEDAERKPANQRHQALADNVLVQTPAEIFCEAGKCFRGPGRIVDPPFFHEKLDVVATVIEKDAGEFALDPGGALIGDARSNPGAG